MTRLGAKGGGGWGKGRLPLQAPAPPSSIIFEKALVMSNATGFSTEPLQD